MSGNKSDNGGSARRIGKSTIVEEFAWALGKEQLTNYIKSCFEKRECYMRM